tara:strand:- start:36 stop:605 length:570 start_codon:yes stop_codon:yes gene_type:complete
MTNSQYTTPLPNDLIAVWLGVFERQKSFGEHAFNLLSDEQFFTILTPGLNSCAIIANHIAGNLISRFTDFLTTDGEKPDRDRDSEFNTPQTHTPQARAEIMDRWETGWGVLFDTLGSLTMEDIGKVVTIRSVPHPVHAAMARAMDHYSFHIGQINIIARQQVGTENWQWFTLPPGGTKAFNAKTMGDQK